MTKLVIALVAAFALAACSSAPQDADCPWVGPVCDPPKQQKPRR
jgi:uncharacterized protein YcfL